MGLGRLAAGGRGLGAGLAGVHQQPLEPGQGAVVHAAAARAGGRGRYDHLEGRRFRHTAQFQRWRPDRDPRSCTYDQLEETVSFDLAEVLATSGH